MEPNQLMEFAESCKLLKKVGDLYKALEEDSASLPKPVPGWIDCRALRQVLRAQLMQSFGTQPLTCSSNFTAKEIETFDIRTTCATLAEKLEAHLEAVGHGGN